jgi:hypothetical protein
MACYLAELYRSPEQQRKRAEVTSTACQRRVSLLAFLSLAAIVKQQSNLDFVQPRLVTRQADMRQSLLAMRYRTSIAEPPAPPALEEKRERKPRFAQCMVSYTDKKLGKKGAESWVFHIEAAEENDKIAEKKPSFPRLLKKNAYIWGRNTMVNCAPLEEVPDIGGPCIECVRLFAGGLYGGGMVVPAFDSKHPSKKSWTAKECLSLRESDQPPNDAADSYAESADSVASGHEPKMSPFCRSGIFSDLFN